MKSVVQRWVRASVLGLVAGLAVFQVSFGLPNTEAVLAATQSSATTGSSASAKPPVVIDEHTSDGVPMTTLPAQGWPSIVSKAAVVMDMNTGTVIYAKNPLTPHYPASITKILTAMIALQHGHLTDLLTTSKRAASQPPDKLYLVPGEVEPLQKLLYGLLLNSANDVAVEIAQHYGGSVAGFATMMNQEAMQLGAVHSHFVNPNGLPDPHHVTTAYDMALITKAAMQIPEFRKIVATRSYDWNGLKFHTQLSNLNGMLFNYPGAIGVKTGYTSVAHETLVVAAKHGNDTFLAVLMDARMDSQIRTDATTLLNFAFKHYQTATILPEGTQVGSVHDPADGSVIRVVTSRPVLATLPLGTKPSVTEQLHLQQPSSAAANAVVGKITLTPTGASSVGVPVEVARAYGMPSPWHTEGLVRRYWIFETLMLLVLAGWWRRAHVRRRRARRQRGYAQYTVNRRNFR